jgi:hypothetical protein
MVEWKVSLCSISFLFIIRVSSNFIGAGYEVLTVVMLNIPVLWGATLCLEEWFTAFPSSLLLPTLTHFINTDDLYSSLTYFGAF